MGSGSTKEIRITKEQLAQNSTCEKCWIVIGNSTNGENNPSTEFLHQILHSGGPIVYDITTYLDKHPGGLTALLNCGGKVADAEFESTGHSEKARKIMKSFAIGKFAT